MSKKRLLAVACVILFGILLNVFILTRSDGYAPIDVEVQLEITADHDGIVQLFYGNNGQFEESSSLVFEYEKSNKAQLFTGMVPSNATSIRLDFPDESSVAWVSLLRFARYDNEIMLTEDMLADAKTVRVDNVSWNNGKMDVSISGTDACVIFADEDFPLHEITDEHEWKINRIKKIAACVFVDLALFGVLLFFRKFVSLPIELYQNRKLIWKLSINDFKTRFAGSYLGIFWAFVQPVVTIVVYWLVFDKGLNVGSTLSRTGISVPFVLWLTAGLVPWFYFQEALMNGTNALIEYNYLVKKVVFKISILPIIKIISALFVHIFFVVFVIILFACYGYYPDLYTLQVIYYSFCMFMLVLAICYTTCAVVIFFRDLSQIISILLQVGTWATPIMWQISIIHNRWLLLFFQLNPMYYVVNGYREALIEKAWFFDNVYMTIYFWGFVAVVFAIGALIFKRLKVHFADVL